MNGKWFNLLTLTSAEQYGDPNFAVTDFSKWAFGTWYKSGTATDTVTSGNNSITITSINDQTVEVSKSTTVAVTTDPADATITAVSSDTGKATVAVSGKDVTITGVAVGTSDITVTAKKTGYTDATKTFRVTVTQSGQQAATLNEIPNATVAAEAYISVTPVFTPIDATITAVSSDTTKATVEVNGSTVKVTGVAQGTAKITVTAAKTGYTSAIREFTVQVTPKQSSAEQVAQLNAPGGTVNGDMALNKTQVYGPEKAPSSTVSGNLTLNSGADNSTLRNVNVNGNLTLNPGDNGNVRLENVEVKGSVNVLSGGGNSIYLKAVKAKEMNVSQDNTISIKVEKDTKIDTTNIKSEATLEITNATNVALSKVNLAPGGTAKKVTLKGDFTKSSVIASGDGILKLGDATTKVPNLKAGVPSAPSKGPRMAPSMAPAASFEFGLEGNFENTELDVTSSVYLKPIESQATGAPAQAAAISKKLKLKKVVTTAPEGSTVNVGVDTNELVVSGTGTVSVGSNVNKVQVVGKNSKVELAPDGNYSVDSMNVIGQGSKVKLPKGAMARLKSKPKVNKDLIGMPPQGTGAQYVAGSVYDFFEGDEGQALARYAESTDLSDEYARTLEIVELEAENGTIMVSLNAPPVQGTPQAGEFAFKLSRDYGRTFENLTVNSPTWDSQTNTAKFTFTPLPKTGDYQFLYIKAEFTPKPSLPVKSDETYLVIDPSDQVYLTWLDETVLLMPDDGGMVTHVFATPVDATISATSSDANVADVVFDKNTSLLKYTGKTVGEATITVKGELSGYEPDIRTVKVAVYGTAEDLVQAWLRSEAADMKLALPSAGDETQPDLMSALEDFWLPISWNEFISTEWASSDPAIKVTNGRYEAFAQVTPDATQDKDVELTMTLTAQLEGGLPQSESKKFKVHISAANKKQVYSYGYNIYKDEFTLGIGAKLNNLQASEIKLKRVGDNGELTDVPVTLGAVTYRDPEPGNEWDLGSTEVVVKPTTLLTPGATYIARVQRTGYKVERAEIYVPEYATTNTWSDVWAAYEALTIAQDRQYLASGTTITLPTGANGTTINWVSPSSRIEITGNQAVIKPGDYTETIELVATILKGENATSKYFYFYALGKDEKLVTGTVDNITADSYQIHLDNAIPTLQEDQIYVYDANWSVVEGLTKEISLDRKNITIRGAGLLQPLQTYATYIYHYGYISNIPLVTMAEGGNQVTFDLAITDSGLLGFKDITVTLHGVPDSELSKFTVKVAGKTMTYSATNKYFFTTMKTSKTVEELKAVTEVIAPQPTNVTVTASAPSTTGFTLDLNPPVTGLTISNVAIKDHNNNPVPGVNVTEGNAGSSYTVDGAFAAGESYAVSITKFGYTFNTVNVVIPQNNQVTFDLTIADSGLLGYKDITVVVQGVPDAELSKYTVKVDGKAMTYSAINKNFVTTMKTSKTVAELKAVTEVIAPQPTNVTVTASDPSTNGFTLGLTPGVLGLTANDILVKDSNNTVVAGVYAIEGAGGTSYTIGGLPFTAGATYKVTITKAGYAFNPVDVTIPQGPVNFELSIADSGLLGYKDITVTLPGVPDAELSKYTVKVDGKAMTYSSGNKYFVTTMKTSKTKDELKAVTVITHQ